MGKYRQQILDAARGLILDKGVLEFSMRDLAKVSGLSTGTLYREVTNKDDLLLYLFADLTKRIEFLSHEFQKIKDITCAERLICTMGFGAYKSEIFDEPLGVDFIGSNFGQVKRASSQAIDEVRLRLKCIHEIYFQNFRVGFKDGLNEVNHQQVTEALDDLLVVTRGLHLVKSSFVYHPAYTTVDKLCKFGRFALNDLPWKDGAGEIDSVRVARAMKTVLDQRMKLNLKMRSRD